MIERRSFTQSQAQPDGLTIVLPFNSLSQDLGGFREKIHPDAFKRSLSSEADILALWSHDTSKPLARRSNGTLSLVADGATLTAKIQGDQTSWSEDARASIGAGTTRGASFGFITRSDSFTRSAGEWTRTLLDVDLLEVSPTPIPAYPQTTAMAG